MRTVLHDLFVLGINEGASDWHVREDKNSYIRCNGELLEINDSYADKDYLDRVLKEICTEKELETYEATGDINFALQEDEVGRFRVNLHRQRGKHALVFRYIKEKIPNFEEAKLPATISKVTENHNGIILITGATGMGKSTTLASIVDHINNNQAKHIVTIEDPIEFIYEDHLSIIQQREVGLDVISFEAALINVLRQDPDVIVIGEIRDRDTFDIALKASQTGHLVLGTLHTNDVCSTVLRIVDLYKVEERSSILKSLSQSLKAIICQKLVPSIDEGRVPVCEILLDAPIVSKVISEDNVTKLNSVIDANINMGMQSFNSHLFKLINDNIITEEVALQYSEHKEALKMNIKGVFLSSDGGIIS